VLCADASSPELEDEIATVSRTLADGGEEGTDEPPTILCLNKMDLVPEGREDEIRRRYPEAVGISALSDAGPLLDTIYASISSERERMEVLIPHDDYGAASRLYGLADIHSRRTTEEGLWMDVSLPRSASARYEPYRVV
jgi:GTP-binding protein HflX